MNNTKKDFEHARGPRNSAYAVNLTYTPLHLALNAVFCVELGHAYMLSPFFSRHPGSPIAVQREQPANGPINYKRDPDELIVHISRARLFAIPSNAIRGSGTQSETGCSK